VDVPTAIVVTNVNALLVHVQALVTVVLVCAKDVTRRLVSVPRTSAVAPRRVLVARASAPIVSLLPVHLMLVK